MSKNDLFNLGNTLSQLGVIADDPGQGTGKGQRGVDTQAPKNTVTTDPKTGEMTITSNQSKAQQAEKRQREIEKYAPGAFPEGSVQEKIRQWIIKNKHVSKVQQLQPLEEMLLKIPFKDEKTSALRSDVLNATNDRGQNIMYEAAFRGNKLIADLLHLSGARTDGIDINGDTLLITAAKGIVPDEPNQKSRRRLLKFLAEDADSAWLIDEKNSAQKQKIPEPKPLMTRTEPTGEDLKNEAIKRANGEPLVVRREEYISEDIEDRLSGSEYLRNGDVTALHIAVKSGDLGAVKQLLESRADTEISGGPLAATPIFTAVNDQNAGIVKALLDQGANADRLVPSWKSSFLNTTQTTPLFLATYFDPVNPEIVQALLEKGASPTTKLRLADSPDNNPQYTSPLEKRIRGDLAFRKYQLLDAISTPMLESMDKNSLDKVTIDIDPRIITLVKEDDFNLPARPGEATHELTEKPYTLIELAVVIKDKEFAQYLVNRDVSIPQELQEDLRTLLNSQEMPENRRSEKEELPVPVNVDPGETGKLRPPPMSQSTTQRSIT